MEEKSVPESIKGLVEKITYINDRNGYTVATVKQGTQRITVVGVLPFLSEGETAEFYGKYVVHHTYGEQFSASSFKTCAPESTAAILRYLSSGIIKGIGPSTATKLVEKFGDKTLDILQNHPEDLAVIKGITIERAYKLSEEYSKQYNVRDIMLLLSPYNVSPERCVKIFRRLGNRATEIIKDNPYVLCGDGIEISFETAEIIAGDFEISQDNPSRLTAGIDYILRKNLLNGHTCLPRNKLTNVAVKMLDSDFNRIESIIDGMISEMSVISKKTEEGEFLSLPDYYIAEQTIATRLTATNRHFSGGGFVDDLEIEYIENKIGIKFDEMQKKAIKTALQSGVFVLTGGPGTGKTTTLNAIISLHERSDKKIELAAPTGRAAKRMTELVGREAKTIHRLLEVEWSVEDKPVFMRNEKNPLDCDVIILDEASMIDSQLFSSLLKALRISTKIILVGDSDQLPSVSAGNVLNDVLQSGCFNSVRLEKVFRQSRESAIVLNAHAIIDETPLILDNKNSDFFFLRRQSAFDTANTVAELVSGRLPDAYGFNPTEDIQVLCPSRKTDNGTVNLNNLLQSYLNPEDKKKPKLSYKGVYYRVGDRVMQIKNNYDIPWVSDGGENGVGVFNGDVGKIEFIDSRAGIMNVRYDDRVVTYYNDDISEIELAYAVTIHKSQGSEFDCVVIPLFDVPGKLRYRNLIYTAVTRAKKILVIVGSEEVLNQMIANNRKTLRYTMLKGMLNEIDG